MFKSMLTALRHSLWSFFGRSKSTISRRHCFSLSVCRLLKEQTCIIESQLRTVHDSISMTRRGASLPPARSCEGARSSSSGPAPSSGLARCPLSSHGCCTCSSFPTGKTILSLFLSLSLSLSLYLSLTHAHRSRREFLASHCSNTRDSRRRK